MEADAETKGLSVIRRLWYLFRSNRLLRAENRRLDADVSMRDRTIEHLEEIIAAYRDTLGTFQKLEHVKTAEAAVYLESIKKAATRK
jgi:hypothetical protein